MNTSSSQATPTVLAVCNHPGGARTLIPVLRVLIERNLVIHVITTYVSLPLFSSLEVFCQAVRSRPGRKDRTRIIRSIQPNVMLFSTSVPDRLDTECLEVSFMATAESEKIKTIAILDHWTCSKDRFLFIGDSDRYVFPDKICVLDRNSVTDMCKIGIPEDRLAITGNPYWDSFKKTKKRLRLMSKEYLRKRLKVESGSRVLLFISQPLSSIDRHVPPYTEFTVLEELLCVLDTTPELADVRLLIKGHPRESTKQLLSILKGTDRSARFIMPSEDVLEVGWISDFVVGMFSTLIVELSLLGIDVVSYQPITNSGEIEFVGEAVQVSRNQVELRDALLKGRTPTPDADRLTSSSTDRVILEIDKLLALKLDTSH